MFRGDAGQQDQTGVRCGFLCYEVWMRHRVPPTQSISVPVCENPSPGRECFHPGTPRPGSETDALWVSDFTDTFIQHLRVEFLCVSLWTFWSRRLGTGNDLTGLPLPTGRLDAHGGLRLISAQDPAGPAGPAPGKGPGRHAPGGLPAAGTTSEQEQSS